MPPLADAKIARNKRGTHLAELLKPSNLKLSSELSDPVNQSSSYCSAEIPAFLLNFYLSPMVKDMQLRPQIPPINVSDDCYHTQLPCIAYEGK